MRLAINGLSSSVLLIWPPRKGRVGEIKRRGFAIKRQTQPRSMHLNSFIYTNRLLALVLAICYIQTSSLTKAATPVCGTIVNQTWHRTNSPYRVTCDIFVAGLTIEPGVVILVESNYVFEVAGVLKAL